jgi:hypothetical protein
MASGQLSPFTKRLDGSPGEDRVNGGDGEHGKK